MAGPFYWVGGTGNWSDATNHWSTSSGGAPNVANVPDSTSDVHFDAGSNTTNAAYTVTVDATANCKDLMFDAKPGDGLGGTITLAGSAALNVYGSLLLLSGMTASYSGNIAMLATTTGKTITCNGVTVNAANFSFSGIGGGWTLTDAFTGTVAAPTFNVTQGTFSTANHNMTCLRWELSGSPSVTLGTSTLTLGSFWTCGSSVALSAAASTILVGSNGNFDGGGLAYGSVTVTAGAANTFTGANSFVNLTMLNTASKTCSWALSANQTVTGTLKYLGNSVTNRLLIQSNTLGTARTITAAAIDGASDFCDFMDITGAGAAAPFATGSSLGNALGNSGITFTPAADQYWYTPTTGTKTWSTAGNWFLGSGGTGGAGRVPLPQDNVIFNASSIGAASTTVSADMPRLGKDITWTGVTNSPTVNFNTVSFLYGSLTLATGMGVSGNQALTLAGRSSHTLTLAGQTLPVSIQFNCIGGTLTLADAFIGSALSPVYGTFSDGGNSVTLTTGFGGGGNPTKILNLSGVWTITGNTAAWSMSSFATTLNHTGTIKFTDATASTKNFTGANKTYNNIWLAGAGSGSFNFTGSNTFADIKVDNLPKDIRLTAATNTTLASFTNADVPATDKFARFNNTTDLILGGFGIKTVSTPSIAITGDAEWVFRSMYTDGANYGISKTTGIGANGYRILTNRAGNIILQWWDGVAIRTAASTANYPFAAGVIGWIKYTIDVNNGVGGCDVKFWYAADSLTEPVSWTQLGATVTQAFTTSIVDTGASLAVGVSVDHGSPDGFLRGDVYRMLLRNGIGGTIVADFNPNDHASGNSWTSATTGEVWTRNGSALIYPEVKISSITNAAHTLTKSGGGTITISKGNISYSTAMPVRTWRSEDGINGGNNTNWLYSVTNILPAASGNLVLTTNTLNSVSSDAREYNFQQPASKSTLLSTNALTVKSSGTRHYYYIRN